MAKHGEIVSRGKKQPTSKVVCLLKKRISDMDTLRREQPTTLTEYEEPHVRRLIEKVTVFEDRFSVEFKSGVMVV